MSVRGKSLLTPQLILEPVTGFLVDDDRTLRARLLRFEHESTTKAIDTVRIELDNGDGKLLSLESIALGIQLRASWGYVGYMTPPMTVTAKRVQGMSGHKQYGGGRRPVRESLGGDGKVYIECQAATERLHRMSPDDGTGSTPPGPRWFENMTLSDIVRAMARHYGYRDEQMLLEPPRHDPVRSHTVVPSDETDAQFLQRQARLLGYVFSAAEGLFRFHSRTFSINPIRLAFFSGDPDVRSYKIDGDLRFGAPRRVSARGVNAYMASVVSHTADAPSDGGSTDTTPSAAETTEVGTRNAPAGAFGLISYEADNVCGEYDVFTVPRASERAVNAAVKRLRNLADRKWKLTVELVGNPILFAKEWFDFSGAGTLVDGLWYARKVLHKYEGGNVYTTVVEEATRSKPSGPARGPETAPNIANPEHPDQTGRLSYVGDAPNQTRNAQREEPTN